MIGYNIGVWAFRSAVWLASPFHTKARKMISGRKGWRERLALGTKNLDRPIWMHCSSLGEFEQGRPLLEAIRKTFPKKKIVLTFFSPSGYEIQKNYKSADYISYLPFDLPSDAELFIKTVSPSLAIFVKYDLWLNHLQECFTRKIPVILISAILRPDSKFLKSSLAKAYQKAFSQMAYIFVQDAPTHDLLTAFCDKDKVIITGDTRFDRAAQLPDKFTPLPEIEKFIRGRQCIVAGSPWPPDEAILLPVIQSLRREDRCWIIAPHEIHPDKIAKAVSESEGKMAMFSKLEGITDTTDVLWIDNIGMLSRLYHYAAVTYIGGGFGSGIHNTQEPAVYGCPLIFGPKYHKFQEAVEMVALGSAVSVTNQEELHAAMVNWLENAESAAEARDLNRRYILNMAGATQAIMEVLTEAKLLA